MQAFHERGPLRFGIISHGMTLPNWRAQCLGHLLNLQDVEAGVLILTPPSSPSAPPGGQIGRRYPAQSALWRVFTSTYLSRRSQALRSVDVADTLEGVPLLRCDIEYSGTTQPYFRDEDLESLRGYNLDFILDFGLDPIGGDVLHVPRYGVWSFRHGDSDANSRYPVSFWEVYQENPVTAAALIRRTDASGQATTLYSGCFKTVPYSYVRTLDKVLLEAASWPARECRLLRSGRCSVSETPALPIRASTPQSPSNVQVVALMQTLARHFAGAAVRKLCYREQWNVGIIDTPIQHFLTAGSLAPVGWLPANRGSFAADPFGLDRGSNAGVLVEGFDFRRGKGHITALTPSANGTFTASPQAIDVAVHVSYPYLVEDGGSVYCIPETHEADEVSLYEAVEFPRRWAKRATLIAGFPVVDATVFQHESRWWMLSARQGDSEQSTLYAWYAPALAGPWTPHPANPLKTDVRCTRPAGTPFVHEGQLYRPTMDCSRGYGGAVTINRVRHLSPSAFIEETAAVVAPDPAGPYPHGLHTLSTFGQRTLIDGKCLVFTPEKAWQILLARLVKTRTWTGGTRDGLRLPSPQPAPKRRTL